MRMSTARELNGTYELDATHSSVAFSIGHMSLSTFHASFGDVEARLVADGARLALEGRTRAESVSIGEPAEFREHVVHGQDFLHARSHPELTFTSRAVELRRDGAATVRGELAIRGIARDVVLEGRYRGPIRDPFGGERVALALRATVDRRAWKMDWQMELPEGGDALGRDDDVSADHELVKAA
jgi:polyisoprenoid-binding protein YceI